MPEEASAMTNTTALARKFRVDVTSDLTLSAGWLELIGIYDLKPSVDPNMVETSAYDTDGWDSFEITGNAWSLTSSFWRRKSAGVYPAAQELLRGCVGQDGDAPQRAKASASLCNWDSSWVSQEAWTRRLISP